MNLRAKFNKFFGIAHHYHLFYSIYKTGRLVNIGSAQWYTFKKSNIKNLETLRENLIESLSSEQKELLKLETASIIITGIT
jgi:hypothetical protein